MERLFLLLAFLINLSPLMAQDRHFNLPLWKNPDDIPNYQATEEQEQADTSTIIKISKVQHPGMEVFLPSERNANGQAVIICPGGGYHILAYDWEGTDIAKWLNAHGIAGIVLKYRLPTSRSQIVPHKSPLLDAQRAMRLARHNAEKWNIDPAKIGIMGFSAGGHLASTLSTHFDEGTPDATDPVERESSRPDFSILMYPVVSFVADGVHAGSSRALLGENPSDSLLHYYSNEQQVTDQSPPAFLVHATNDSGVPSQNSIIYYEALKEHNIPAELNIYPYGGHGFSLAVGNDYLNTWTDRCIGWLKWLDEEGYPEKVGSN